MAVEYEKALSFKVHESIYRRDSDEYHHPWNIEDDDAGDDFESACYSVECHHKDKTVSLVFVLTPRYSDRYGDLASELRVSLKQPLYRMPDDFGISYEELADAAYQQIRHRMPCEPDIITLENKHKRRGRKS